MTRILRSAPDLFRRSYAQVLAEKNRLIENYRNAATFTEHLASLRNDIQKKKDEALATLNDILLSEFNRLGIKFEQAVWDKEKEVEGKPKKRNVTYNDIEELQPFHWGFEFDKVLQERGGFDAIITNPPWEVFQTDEKEFFQEHVPTIEKNKLRIEDWRKQQKKLMRDKELRDAWLRYASGFPHVSSFFKQADQYKNQRSVDSEGKRIPSKINLYTYFTEQSFNLLRPGGQCGIVIPSGIYTDLGTKQLREMLFSKTFMTGLFGFENRKEVFEGVHRSFKFIVLTYEKGGTTAHFPAAFMRLDASELDRFPEQGAINVSVALVRKLSPGSLSIMEFGSPLDVEIVQKMASFPSLGTTIDGTWNVTFGQEINMTTDSFLFKTSSADGRLPLYEGKMIHQFDHRFSEPRYWVDEKAARKTVLGGSKRDEGTKLDYQHYRLGFRDIARNTDSRTMIATVIPRERFAGNTAIVSSSPKNGRQLLLIAALLDSFAVDYIIRMKVSTHCNMFYVYQLPVPRLTETDAAFEPIVERSARLICTVPEFDDLAKEVGLGNHKAGATDPAERARLRAELDGLVAHLYGLTEEEFAHILATFPLVPDPVKIAAQNAFRDVERGLIR